MFVAPGPRSRSRRITAARGAVFLIALALFSAVLASCSSSRTPPPSHRPVPAADGGTVDSGTSFPTDASTTPLDVTIADLAAAGLSVFADANQTSPMFPPPATLEPSPYRLLNDQANAMIAEADARQGTLGSDLDGLIVLGSDLPPASYFLAGYVSAAGTPGAKLARKVMGTQDWLHAPTVVYPTLVFALFAADAARYANALAGPQATSTAAQSLSLPAGLCSDVANFIDGTISGFFDALGHLKAPKIPSTGVGIVDWFGSGLQAALNLGAQVINGVIDGGRFIVVAGVKAATQPLLDAIATVAGPIGVAVEVIAVLRPWTMKMDATPLQTERGVDPGAGVPGTITGTVTLPGGLDEWPALFVDCAKVANVTLPALKPVGAPVTWKLAQSPDPLVVQDTGAAIALDDKASASISYVTTTESAKAARGTKFEGKVKATITIRRKEIADLQKTIADAVFAQIPGLVRPLVEAVLRPAVNTILALPPALLDTHGYQPLVVTYHECQSGDCCPPGQIACGTLCVDPATDALNCNGCDMACPSGQPCVDGACVPHPTPTTTACPPPCAVGQACSGGTCRTIIGSCFNSGPTAPTCSDEFDPDAKRSCVGGNIFKWSDLPCPTGNRLGSCDLGDFILRYYVDTGVPHGSCTEDATCSGPEAIQCPGAPVVDIPYPCVGGLCDNRETAEVAAYECCFDCTANPQNPYPAVCPLWTAH